MDVVLPGLDGPGQAGRLRTRWFSMVLTEAATFLEIMLLVAFYLALFQDTKDHGPSPLQIGTKQLLWFSPCNRWSEFPAHWLSCQDGNLWGNVWWLKGRRIAYGRSNRNDWVAWGSLVAGPEQDVDTDVCVGWSQLCDVAQYMPKISVCRCIPAVFIIISNAGI
jgi:hypothetical protein